MRVENADTLAEAELPPDVLAEMERLNREAARHHIWLRTRANAPQKRPWPEAGESEAGESESGEIETAAAMTASPPALPQTPPATFRAVPHVWRWTDIEPYLHRIADIAPLEFTDRQQFLLTNPGLGGALRVTGTMRVAVSIYKPGDVAVTHMHTPNASRTIVSAAGGYSTIEGEQCLARRGDLILTPNGTWHGHGNDDETPVIWMDVLDWPLLEHLDCIWISEAEPGHLANRPAPGTAKRLFGAGGMVPRFATRARNMAAGGAGPAATRMYHFDGDETRRRLAGLAGEDGSAYEGIIMAFTNPETSGPVFPTLDYRAQLLRPGEKTLPYRHTANTLYWVLDGAGHTEVAGGRLDWAENDIFVVPNHLWRHHVNGDSGTAAVLYSVTDAPLFQAIGQYFEQGRTASGEVVEL